ncbi:MAG: hypothetical protein QW510_02855 [Candidatus Bathyarchaeia archaeon]
MKQEIVKKLVESLGERYSTVLGINIESGREDEIFKWFLASILFGAPIKETSVIKTYRCFEKHNVLTPKAILAAGWNGLVRILDEGGYARYDFRTADKLLEAMRNLIEKYDGKLTKIYENAGGSQELENLLKGLGKGIGDTTISIFLRELRVVWDKAKPNPTSLVVLAAKNLGIVNEGSPKNILQQLEEFWAENAVPNKSFVNFETALLRLGKNYCRRAKCNRCPVKAGCLNPKVA